MKEVLLLPIQIHCQCRLRFQVRSQHAGQRVRCPRCGRVLTVPDPTRTGTHLELHEPGEVELTLVPEYDDPFLQAPSRSGENVNDIDVSDHDLAAALEHQHDPAQLAGAETIDVDPFPRPARRKRSPAHIRLLLASFLALLLVFGLMQLVVEPTLANRRADATRRIRDVESLVLSAINQPLRSQPTPTPRIDSIVWDLNQPDPVPFQGLVLRDGQPHGEVRGQLDLQDLQLTATITCGDQRFQLSEKLSSP